MDGFNILVYLSRFWQLALLLLLLVYYRKTEKAKNETNSSLSVNLCECEEQEFFYSHNSSVGGGVHSNEKRWKRDL